MCCRPSGLLYWGLAALSTSFAADFINALVEITFGDSFYAVFALRPASQACVDECCTLVLLSVVITNAFNKMQLGG